MVSILAALVLTQTPVYQATRFDMGERLKRMEAAWMTAGKAEKEAAVPLISQAVTGFFSGNFGASCRALDEGWAALEKRSPRPEDALTIQTAAKIFAPDDVVIVRFMWAYAPKETGAVEVKGAGMPFNLMPGEARLVQAGPFNPIGESTLRRGRTLEIGSLRNELVISAAPGALRAELEASSNELVRNLVAATAPKDNYVEQVVDLASYLEAAQLIQKGAKPGAGLRDVPYAIQGRTPLRARFPEKLGEKPTVVIALHGAGGSENMFFDSYGAGLTPKLADERGWILVSPRSGASAVADSVEWLKGFGIVPGKLVVMGHSMGGGVALQSGASKPDAVVLFAPAAAGIPPVLADTPIYLAVGAQEMMMLKGGADRMGATLRNRTDCAFVTIDPAEHLMIVADALPGAFAWLDKTLTP